MLVHAFSSSLGNGHLQACFDVVYLLPRQHVLHRPTVMEYLPFSPMIMTLQFSIVLKLVLDHLLDLVDLNQTKVVLLISNHSYHKEVIPDKKLKFDIESRGDSGFTSRCPLNFCVESREEANVEDDPPKSKSKNCVFVKRSRSLAKSSALIASENVRGDMEFRLAIASWLRLRSLYTIEKIERRTIVSLYLDGILDGWSEVGKRGIMIKFGLFGSVVRKGGR